MNQEFGDRMKQYEMAEAGRKLMPLLPALARIDGRCFSRFTQKMNRPFDGRFSELMIETATFLLKETNATIAYTQSDEISLAWLPLTFEGEIFFGGRVQKMVSLLASLTTAFFVRELPRYFPDHGDQLPSFDCRVWNVPNLAEGANVFLWRELDATKNSIFSAARCYYTHQELQNKTGKEMQEMLWQKGINWNDYPQAFKRGRFIQRRAVTRRFRAEEIDQLPAQHRARREPELEFERTEFVPLSMPPFAKVLNRAEVIFHGAEPRTKVNLPEESPT